MATTANMPELPRRVVSDLLDGKRGALYLAGRLAATNRVDADADMPEPLIEELALHIDAWLRNVVMGAAVDDGYAAYCCAIAAAAMKDSRRTLPDPLPELGMRHFQTTRGLHVVVPASFGAIDPRSRFEACADD